MTGIAHRAAILALLVLIGGIVLGEPKPVPDSASQEQIAPYLTPQRLVQVGEGRTINLVCLGQGSPTVILTAGLQAWSVAWRLVQQPLAQRTRVCAWDRAGYGFSGPSPEPQDTVHTTEDLERALKAAGIGGPYVMVGHSLGAYESLRFTDLHRQSVAGMVLVDPAIPDQIALLKRIAPMFYTKGRGEVVEQLRDCAAKLQNGTLKRGAAQQCTADPTVPDDFPRLKAEIARRNTNPARLLTQASLNEVWDTNDSREIINAQRRYGDMPLIVLTAGRDESQVLQMFDFSTPGEEEQFRKQVEQYLQDAWVPGHDAYAALSTRGRNQVVPDSTHSIQLRMPEVVIAAVNEALNEIHTGPLHGQ